MIIDDESDIYRSSPECRIVEGDFIKALKVREPSAAAVLAGGSFDLIWLSSVIERLTPVQAAIILRRAAEARSGSKGIVAGYFGDYAISDPGSYFLDPRRLRPISREFVTSLARACGFENVQLEADCAHASVVHFRLS